jgi:hypothetical protein
MNFSHGAGKTATGPAARLIACSLLVCAWGVLARTSAAQGSQDNDAQVVYRNTEYGFCFSLPATWKGYTIVTEQWTGFPLDHGAGATGPKLLIRHPAWTQENPREDIPVMIFTTAEWKRVKGANASMGVSAAPFPPSELAHNRRYVFALPPRWDFDQLPGVEEAGKLILSKALRAPCR